MPQSTETTRILPPTPVDIYQVAQAVTNGEMPNPCYLMWQDKAMVKLSYDGALHCEVQVCGEPSTQEPTNCTTYSCESNFDDDVCTITRTFECMTGEDVESDLNELGFGNVQLVKNDEDWFPRLQYWMSI